MRELALAEAQNVVDKGRNGNTFGNKKNSLIQSQTMAKYFTEHDSNTRDKKCLPNNNNKRASSAVRGEKVKEGASMKLIKMIKRKLENP